MNPNKFCIMFMIMEEIRISSKRLVKGKCYASTSKPSMFRILSIWMAQNHFVFAYSFFCSWNNIDKETTATKMKAAKQYVNPALATIYTGQNLMDR